MRKSGLERMEARIDGRRNREKGWRGRMGKEERRETGGEEGCKRVQNELPTPLIKTHFAWQPSPLL